MGKIMHGGIEYSGGGGGGASTLAELTDVDITTPEDGQTLKYDSSSQQWINANAGGGGGFAMVNIYENQSSTNPATVTLNDDFTNYDILIVRCKRFADNLYQYIDYPLVVNGLVTGQRFVFLGWQANANYVTFQVYNAKNWTRVNQGSNFFIYQVYGLKF